MDASKSRDTSKKSFDTNNRKDASDSRTANISRNASNHKDAGNSVDGCYNRVVCQQGPNNKRVAAIAQRTVGSNNYNFVDDDILLCDFSLLVGYCT
jgi:hypothetical protein